MKKIITAVSFALLLSNCSSYGDKKNQFHQNFNTGNYAAAARVMLPNPEKDCSKDEFKDEGFLFSLNSGTSFLFSKEYNLSTQYLSVSEAFMIEEETDGYNVKYYDKIMLSTYKAMAYLEAGDIQNARIEFNRAYSHQAAAIEDNKGQITKLQEEAKEENSAQTIKEAQSVIAKEYTEFDGFKAYSDFANPYTTYMSGLFFTFADGSSKSDIENGINYLKRVQKMSPNNKFISKDIAMGNDMANGKKAPATVWVVYENGLVSDVDVQRIVIPFYLASGVKVANITLPKLVPQAEAYPSIQVQAKGKKVTSTQPVGDMDRVVKTEFKSRFPMEVTKAIIWTTANLIAQEAAQQAIGKDDKLMGAIAAAGISTVSNPVDTRTWTSLPKNVQIARVKMPKDRKLTIYDNNGNPLAEEVTFEKGTKYALVYVRVPTIGAVPSVSVTKFK